MSDKTLYFFKQPQDFWHSHEIKVIGAHPKGKQFGKMCQLFYNKIITESTSYEGNLRFNAKIPYNAQTLGAVLDEETEFVQEALDWLVLIGVVEILEDETIYIPIVAKLTESIKRKSLKRRTQRAKKQEEETAKSDKKATLSQNCRTEQEQELELELELELDIEEEDNYYTKNVSDFVESAIKNIATNNQQLEKHSKLLLDNLQSIVSNIVEYEKTTPIRSLESFVDKTLKTKLKFLLQKEQNISKYEFTKEEIEIAQFDWISGLGKEE